MLLFGYERGPGAVSVVGGADARGAGGEVLPGAGAPTRLRVLELVEDRERSVSELVELLGVPQPKVSKHLACLRWCGFVTTRREHRTVYYRLADERVTAVLELGRALLADNAEHVAACGTIDGPC
jgi:DNA-binding transcriptional ArsR family regulator